MSLNVQNAIYYDLIHPFVDSINSIDIHIISVLYSIMLLFQRGTLANELEHRRAKGFHLEVTEVLRIFSQICEGVKAFHEAKPFPLAHRDLKTANILLDVDSTPVIMDLGKWNVVHNILTSCNPSLSMYVNE